MPEPQLSLIAHLIRRAGFGATHAELEAYAARGYETVLEDLLHPEQFPEIEQDLLDRYYGPLDEDRGGDLHELPAGVWIHRMVHTRRPLEEKIALFWHHVFATGFAKSEHRPSMNRQIEMFRRVGLSDLRNILMELSRDPAMLYWLDNNENHKDQPNENYGRELLELFSMGVGNYTEQDIKMAARAFTGWTFKQPIPLYTQGSHQAEFVFLEDDHDDSVKTFLSETGPFNGEDIVDIIVKQPATARFICRHLYNFFVADEPQVPAWDQVPPRDPAAIDILVEAFVESGGEIRATLRALFSSQSFKDARLKRVKSPVELVVGVLKLVGISDLPEADIARYADATTFMAQTLYDPPSVEGWHTGQEWIDGGTLTERVNFAVGEVGDASKPGIRAIVERFAGNGAALSPDDFVDQCLVLAGALTVGDETREAFVREAEAGGELRFGNDARQDESTGRIVRMLEAIVACREYQFA
jgi:uncharacterized protein (DUF1800 family)